MTSRGRLNPVPGRLCLVLAVAILSTVLTVTPASAQELVNRPLSPPPSTHFDWRLYVSWARAHHHPGIPLTRFSWPWMAHRGLCGGAVSKELLNLRTMAYIQDFDRCWARWSPTGKAPTFMRYAGAGFGNQAAGIDPTQTDVLETWAAGRATLERK